MVQALAFFNSSDNQKRNQAEEFMQQIQFSGGALENLLTITTNAEVR